MGEKNNKSSDVYTSVDDVYTIIDDKESVEKILMMTGEQQLFQVITEDGIERTASLMSVVEIQGKEYAIYTIPSDEHPGKVDVLASYVVQDENGYDSLRDIDNFSDKAKVYNYVRSLLMEAKG